MALFILGFMIIFFASVIFGRVGKARRRVVTADAHGNFRECKIIFILMRITIQQLLILYATVKSTSKIVFWFSSPIVGCVCMLHIKKV